MRNPDGGPIDILYNEWPSPEDKSKIYKFNKYVMHCAFNIPVGAEVSTKSEEDALSTSTSSSGGMRTMQKLLRFIAKISTNTSLRMMLHLLLRSSS
jgi:hypothetical protein